MTDLDIMQKMEREFNELKAKYEADMKAIALALGLEAEADVEECISRIHKLGPFAPITPSTAREMLDNNRCAVCGWPLKESVDLGCVRGNCSQRPVPQQFYDYERAQRERSTAREKEQ